MKASMLRFLGAIVLSLSLLSMLTCGHNQKLVSITLQPETETFGASNIPVSADAGLSVQLRALGNYIHPPVTKDITNKVIWSSNDPQMVTVSSSGVITATGNSCGGTLISATVDTNSSAGGVSSSGAIVTSTMNAKVQCFTSTGGGSGALLTVTFQGSGLGTVTMSQSGVICSATCTVGFATGTMITLTAATNGTFGGWGPGCDTVTGQTCTINSLTNNLDVPVTFN